MRIIAQTHNKGRRGSIISSVSGTPAVLVHLRILDLGNPLIKLLTKGAGLPAPSSEMVGLQWVISSCAHCSPFLDTHCV